MCVCDVCTEGALFFLRKAQEACRWVIDRYLCWLLPHRDGLCETAAAPNSCLTVVSWGFNKYAQKKKKTATETQMKATIH